MPASSLIFFLYYADTGFSVRPHTWQIDAEGAKTIVSQAPMVHKVRTRCPSDCCEGYARRQSSEGYAHVLCAETPVSPRAVAEVLSLEGREDKLGCNELQLGELGTGFGRRPAPRLGT